MRLQVQSGAPASAGNFGAPRAAACAAPVWPALECRLRDAGGKVHLGGARRFGARCLGAVLRVTVCGVRSDGGACLAAWPTHAIAAMRAAVPMHASAGMRLVSTCPLPRLLPCLLAPRRLRRHRRHAPPVRLRADAGHTALVDARALVQARRLGRGRGAGLALTRARATHAEVGRRLWSRNRNGGGQRKRLEAPPRHAELGGAAALPVAGGREASQSDAKGSEARRGERPASLVRRASKPPCAAATAAAAAAAAQRSACAGRTVPRRSGSQPARFAAATASSSRVATALQLTGRGEERGGAGCSPRARRWGCYCCEQCMGKRLHAVRQRRLR
eukprot:364125-Chlamydomonas_euryale.AAC.4